MARLTHFFVLFVSLFFVSSCGYRIQKGLPFIGDSDRKGPSRIFIPMVDNLSTRTGIEAPMTTALRQAFASTPGVILVSQETGADYILLVAVTEYKTRRGNPSSKATEEDEARGGLKEKQSSAADIKLDVSVRVDLLENVMASESLRRKLWSREFEETRSFEAYLRFEELTGSSSAPHVNRSRESIVAQQISESFSRQIIDQVVQNF